jgi:hypothetical protein
MNSERTNPYLGKNLVWSSQDLCVAMCVGFFVGLVIGLIY